MPVLVYTCKDCNHTWEIFHHKFTDKCPECEKCKSKNTERKITKPAENPFGAISWFKFS